ncbi:MAG: deoxyribose-phosphate aldolase [Lachnospiraceae bacterium]|jgi:deoxyribose-phosphate aldolase
MNIDIENIVKHCDHTLLKPESTWEQIRQICDQGMAYQTASICIPASYVQPCYEYMHGRERMEPVPICTVIGFPNGYDTTAAKVFMAEDAIRNGASEVDMVINIGWLKDHEDQKVLDEIREVRKATEGHVLKVIIETCLLSEDEKIRMCDIVTKSGADFIKTSTGFSTGGATFADVKLMKAHVGAGVKVKASGGISSLEDAQTFLDLGAERLGTSRIIRILEAEKAGK